MRTTDALSDAPLARVQAEAAAWIALLHNEERNAEIEGGLKRWIAADPLHASAWEAATDIWNETAGLPQRIPQARALTSRSKTRRFLAPALAVATLCLLIAGVVFERFFHGTVNTAVGEQRSLTLEDGTRVELNTNSHIKVSYDHHTRTVVLESGEAYFQVAREQRPFTVIAGEKKILALGTAFTVRREGAQDDSITVTLIEGRVVVAPVEVTAATREGSAAPADEVKILKPGERLRVRKHDTPTLDAPSIDKATGWMRGQLIFDHTPLREALAEFNRYSALKITVASPRTAAIPVGGIFRISDSRSFARAVAETYNLRLTLQDNELILDDGGEGTPESRHP